MKFILGLLQSGNDINQRNKPNRVSMIAGNVNAMYSLGGQSLNSFTKCISWSERLSHLHWRVCPFCHKLESRSVEEIKSQWVHSSQVRHTNISTEFEFMINQGKAFKI